MPTCFVIMPISTPSDLVAEYGGDAEHFQHVLTELHQPAIERAGFDVIPPAVVNSEVIQAEIFRHLAGADLVLCDMSTHNPNVFFELGIRVMFDRPVAMIRDSRTSTIPFDTGIVSCHTYGWRLDSWEVRNEIPRLTDWIKEAGRQKRNALWRLFAEPVAPAATGAVNADYMLAVVTLLERTGLSKRTETLQADFDQKQRAVKLAFATPPAAFLQTHLQEEAAKLGLTLDIQ